MKKALRSLALVGGCCLGILGFHEAAYGQGFYFSGNLGVALADDVDLDRFLVRTPGIEFELDPGMRLSAAGGFNFNEYIGLGLETGFIYNNVDKAGGGGNIDAGLAHVPLLANVVLRYDKADCKWVPYLGAAVGGDVSVIALDHVRAPNGAVVDGSDSTLVFAWQVFGGLRYKLNAAMSIGGGYKFYSANGASWDVDGASGDISTGRAQIHSFGVDFTLKF